MPIIRRDEVTDEEIAQIATAELEKQYALQQWGVLNQIGDTFCISFDGSNIYGYLTWVGAVYVYLSTNPELDFWSYEHEDDFFDVIDNIEGITNWIRENI